MYSKIFTDFTILTSWNERLVDMHNKTLKFLTMKRINSTIYVWVFIYNGGLVACY